MLSVRIGLAVVGFGVLCMFIRDHLHTKRSAKPVNEPPKERVKDFLFQPGYDSLALDSLVNGVERRVLQLDHNRLIVNVDEIILNGRVVANLAASKIVDRPVRRTKSKLVHLHSRYHLPQKRNSP